MDFHIKEILTRYKKIAVIGLSPNSDRASYGVTRYLIEQGYDVVGVRPGTQEILGVPVYSSLKEIPGEVEIVDVFRDTAAVPAIVEEAIQKKAKVLWLQEGVTHTEAEKRARDAGLSVVSNRCILKEHRKI